MLWMTSARLGKHDRVMADVCDSLTVLTNRRSGVPHLKENNKSSTKCTYEHRSGGGSRPTFLVSMKDINNPNNTWNKKDKNDAGIKIKIRPWTSESTIRGYEKASGYEMHTKI